MTTLPRVPRGARVAVDGNVDPNFTIVMRGYERDEVDAYLRDVVAETSRLGERVAQLEADLRSCPGRLRRGPRVGLQAAG